jgi:hypothetical protein
LTDRRYTPTSYTPRPKLNPQEIENMNTPENGKPAINLNAAIETPNLDASIGKLADDVAKIVTEGTDLFKPTLAQRAKRAGKVALKVGIYGAGAAALGGIAWVGYKALKGTPAEAIADAVGDAATAVADAATDAVAAALR